MVSSCTSFLLILLRLLLQWFSKVKSPAIHTSADSRIVKDENEATLAIEVRSGIVALHDAITIYRKPSHIYTSSVAYRTMTLQGGYMHWTTINT